VSRRAMSLGHHLGTEPSSSVLLQLPSQGSADSLLQGSWGQVGSRAVVAVARDLKWESEQQQQEVDGSPQPLLGIVASWVEATEIRQVSLSGTVAVPAGSVPHLCPGQTSSGFIEQV